MTKIITRGKDARDRVRAGVVKAAQAVRPTLGAVGMTALIEWQGLDPVLADDGITILRNLEFSDPHENMGLLLLKKGAMRSSAEGRDGTATTTVLTDAFVEAAFAEVGEDSHRIPEVKKRLELGLQDALAQLSKQATQIRDEDLERVAEVSSLDPEVAKLVAEAIRKVGPTGAITVERNAKLGYSVETVQGMRFDKGLISPFFVNDHENTQTVLENPYIILVDRTVSLNEQIIPILTSIGTGQHILFVATDVQGVALATLAQNAMQGVAQIACVQNPYNATPGRDFLFDLAALTGAEIISEEKGMRLEDATKALCGRASKVVVTRDRTTIIGGKGDASTRVAELETKLADTTSDFQKGELRDRIAALTGGIGVIKVGTYTDTEYNAKKYKFDNAIASTQAAMQEGILPGGGVALAKIGATDPMFRSALVAPLAQMAVNAGRKPEDIVATVRANHHMPNQGFDFRTGELETDMVEAGIMDPHKVVRTALESAVAMTLQLVGFETAITVERDEAKA